MRGTVFNYFDRCVVSFGMSGFRREKKKFTKSAARGLLFKGQNVIGLYLYCCWN